MKKKLLLIGGATESMVNAITDFFELYRYPSIDNVAKDEIEAIITNGHDGVPADLMASLPSLAVISCYGVGYDAIDVAAAKARNIMVTHTPNVLNEDVANAAIMLLLATSRRLVEYDGYVRRGDWETKGNAPLTDSIEGKHIGFLGMGRIGQTVARKCVAFAMKISYHAPEENPALPYTYYASLIDMARDVRYLVIVAPGGDATRHLVNADVLEALGAEGTLINIGRGSIVDEAALTEALQNKIIKSAGLDVFADEPRVSSTLRALDTVVLQPHVASGTIETRHAMGKLTVDNAIEFFKTGKAISPVPEMEV